MDTCSSLDYWEIYTIHNYHWEINGEPGALEIWKGKSREAKLLLNKYLLIGRICFQAGFNKNKDRKCNFPPNRWPVLKIYVLGTL